MRALAAALALALTLIAAGCGASSPRPPPRITVTPAAALWDRARAIVVSRLAPGQKVTIVARTVRPDGTWRASATFKASRRGVVDVATQEPIGGSYRGVSPMGLVWAQTRIAAAAAP